MPATKNAFRTGTPATGKRPRTGNGPAGREAPIRAENAVPMAETSLTLGLPGMKAYGSGRAFTRPARETFGD